LSRPAPGATQRAHRTALPACRSRVRDATLSQRAPHDGSADGTEEQAGRQHAAQTAPGPPPCTKSSRPEQHQPAPHPRASSSRRSRPSHHTIRHARLARHDARRPALAARHGRLQRLAPRPRLARPLQPLDGGAAQARPAPAARQHRRRRHGRRHVAAPTHAQRRRPLRALGLRRGAAVGRAVARQRPQRRRHVRRRRRRHARARHVPPHAAAPHRTAQGRRRPRIQGHHVAAAAQHRRPAHRARARRRRLAGTAPAPHAHLRGAQPHRALVALVDAALLAAPQPRPHQLGAARRRRRAAAARRARPARRHGAARDAAAAHPLRTHRRAARLPARRVGAGRAAYGSFCGRQHLRRRTAAAAHAQRRQHRLDERRRERRQLAWRCRRRRPGCSARCCQRPCRAARPPPPAPARRRRRLGRRDGCTAPGRASRGGLAGHGNRAARRRRRRGALDAARAAARRHRPLCTPAWLRQGGRACAVVALAGAVASSAARRAEPQLKHRIARLARSHAVAQPLRLLSLILRRRRRRCLYARQRGPARRRLACARRHARGAVCRGQACRSPSPHRPRHAAPCTGRLAPPHAPRAAARRQQGAPRRLGARQSAVGRERAGRHVVRAQLAQPLRPLRALAHRLTTVRHARPSPPLAISA
ncbi:hypothetical protein FA09DRAFT_118512, partial [Tilletiopsis washingtonensis]